MDIKAWITRRLGGATQQEGTAPFSILGLNEGGGSSPRRSLRQLGEEGFAENVTAYAGITLRARATAAISWLLYERKGKTLREITSHPLLALLAKPSPWQSGPELIETIEAQRLVTGNSFTFAVRPRDGEPPRELWPLTPHELTIEQGPREPVAAYVYRKGLPNEQAFAPALVLHQKMITVDGSPWGLSPLAVAAGAIDADNEAMRWNGRLLRNDARPPGALRVDGALSQQQRDQLRKEIREKFSGAHNAGKPLVLEAGVNWQAFGLSPADLDWINGIKLSHTLIARALGVPGELIGDSEHKTYASYAEARASFYQETVLSDMLRLRDNLNAWLTPLFGEGLILDFDRDQIEALQEERGKLWSRVRDADWLTVNEKRHATGYEEIAGGDVILVSSAMMPLGGPAVTGEGSFLGAGATIPIRRKGALFLQAASGVELKRSGA